MAAAKERVPFPAPGATREYGGALFKVIGALHTKNVNAVLNPRNVQHLYHGVNWRTHSGDAAAREVSTLTEHRVEHSVRFEDVVQHKLELIPSTINAIVEGMRSQFMAMLYQTVHDSTERSGNVVNAADSPSPQEAFLQAISKVEFGIDEKGQVSLPEIHIAPGNPLPQLLQGAGAEFEARVNALIEEKTIQARQREEERLSKFKV